MKVAHGVCVGSEAKLNLHVLPRLPLGTRATYLRFGQTSIAQAYNSIMDEALGEGVDILVLQHDDLEIMDPWAHRKFRNAFTADPGVALAGVAGGSGQGLAWWNGAPVGRVRADSGMLDFGTHAGEVDSLDGMLLVFSRWALENLRFWDRAGFHGYDCDISAQARAAGMKVVVVAVDVHHHTTLGFKSAASEADWLDADRQYREKWGIADA